MATSGGSRGPPSKQPVLLGPGRHLTLTLTALACFALAVYATTPANNGPCPNDWELQGQKCFRFLKEDRDWQGSRDYCISIGGDLVVLESQAEADYLEGKMRGYNAHTFLGCRDVVKEGHWVCEGYDPSTTYYDQGGSSSGHWRAGTDFYAAGGSAENCLEIYHDSTTSHMNDVSCDTLDPLVSCQIRLGITSVPQQPITTTITTPKQVTTVPDQVTTAPEQVTSEPEQVTTEPEQVTTEPEQVTTEPELATGQQTSARFVDSLFTSPYGPGHCLSERVVAQYTSHLTLQCALRCLRAQWCVSFNTIKDGDQTKVMTCQLNDAVADETSNLQETVGCTTFNRHFV